MIKSNENISVSFEFFPPKTEKAEEVFWKTVYKLETLNPSFVSMTYGADGSKQNTSLRIIQELCKRNWNVAAHLTCVGASRDQINNTALDFINLGANQIVALRGDAPTEAGRYFPHPDGYQNAAELVKGLRCLKKKQIEISVGGYPEIHPDSVNEEEDLDNLKRKVDAGADRILTQFFFDNEFFLRFRDKAVSAGISVPIIPGIMPIMNFCNIKIMAQKVGTSIPEWLENQFLGLEEDLETLKFISMNVLGKQVLELKREGVKDFHFYTMNRGELTFALCYLIGIRPNSNLITKKKF